MRGVEISARAVPADGPPRVALADAVLVARGYFRLVYEHPNFPGALIKVFRPERVSPEGDLICRKRPLRIKLRRRVGAHALTLREFAEHLAFQARHGAAWRERPFAAVLGVVDTDGGLGLVVERIADPAGGGLAPTLDSLLKRGLFSEAHRPALERFFLALEERHVCIGDLRAKNIVLTGSPGEAPRFVAIDGTGLHAAIPLQDWFKPLNTVQVRKRARRVWAVVERHAREARSAFEPAGFAAA